MKRDIDITDDHEAYRGFAEIYDEMMMDRDYSQWADYVCWLIKKYGHVQSGELLDLACGTGSFLKEMADRGWEISGLDLSEDMLKVAQKKLQGAGYSVTLKRDDIRKFQIGRSFEVITCLCDSLNYLLSEGHLLAALKHVKQHLVQGGVFIADLNSEYKYRWLMGEDTFAETFVNSAYIWENFYDVQKGICRMEIDFFIREQGRLFRHFHEVHRQRAYRQKVLRRLALEAGFTQVIMLEAFTERPVNPEREEELLVQAVFSDYPEAEEAEISLYAAGRLFLILS